MSRSNGSFVAKGSRALVGATACLSAPTAIANT